MRGISVHGRRISKLEPECMHDKNSIGVSVLIAIGEKVWVTWPSVAFIGVVLVEEIIVRISDNCLTF